MYGTIITKQVLNKNTGEVENIDFRQMKDKRKIKGGYGMTYNSYDDVLKKVIRSELDTEIFLMIKNLFTYNNSNIKITVTQVAKKIKCTRQKVNSVILRMVNSGFLYKKGDRTYLLNPFIYLPYRADGSELQKEWMILNPDLEKEKQEQKELIEKFNNKRGQ